MDSNSLRSLFNRIIVNASSMGGVLAGAGFSLMIRVAATLLAYLSLVLLARWMGPAEFGVFAFAFAVVTVLTMPSTLGLHLVVLRDAALYHDGGGFEKLRALLVTSYGATLLVASLMAIAGVIVALNLPTELTSEYGRPVMIALFALPALGIITISRSLGLAIRSMTIALGPDQIGYNLFMILIPGFLVLMGMPLHATTVAFVLLASYWSAALVQLGALLKRLWPQLKGKHHLFETSLWFRSAFSFFVVEACHFLMMYTDLLMIGALMDPQSVGYFNAAARTAILVTFFLQAFAGRIAPEIVACQTSGDRAGLQKLLSQTAVWVCVPAVLVSLGLVAVGPFALRLFGAGFESGYPSLAILVLGYLVQSLFGPGMMLLSMAGLHHLASIVYFSAFVVNIVLNLILIPSFGMVGAALATCLSVSLTSLGLMVVAITRLHVNPTVLASLSKMRSKSAEQ